MEPKSARGDGSDADERLFLLLSVLRSPAKTKRGQWRGLEPERRADSERNNYGGGTWCSRKYTVRYSQMRRHLAERIDLASLATVLPSPSTSRAVVVLVRRQRKKTQDN